jgi:hypothetical protein
MSGDSATSRRQCWRGLHWTGGAVLALLLGAPADLTAGVRAPADPDEPAILDCGATTAVPPLSCVFRAPAAAKIEAISATDEDAAQKPSAGFVQFTTARARELGYREANLLLIDVTRGLNNGRLSTLKQTQSLAREIINGMPQTARLAVATFGTDLRLIAAFDQSRTNLLAAVDRIRFDEVNTRLYGSLFEAIALLKEQDATTGRIILLSDGLPEDDRSVNERKVVRAAINAGISISALALYWNSSGSPLNGSGGDVMRTLAKETLGTFDDILIHSQPITAARFLNGIEQQRDNSGFVQVADAPRSTLVSVKVAEPPPGRPGTIVRNTYAATLQNAAAKIPADPEPEPSLDWRIWLLVAAGASLALLVLIWLVVSRQSGREGEEEILASVVEPEAHSAGATPNVVDTDSGDATRAVREPATASPAMAYIFRADVASEPYVVRGSRVRIGRSGDNDLILSHDSVSRVHAEVHRTRRGVFAIRDAGSLNKVRVNGAEVDNADLRDGDLIQLGDTCLRFEYPKREPGAG